MLLATDGSPAALRATRWVRGLALQLPGLSVTLLRVLPAATGLAEVVSGSEASERVFREAEAILGDTGVAVTRNLAAGGPGEEIDRIAGALHCDLIVMGRRGIGALRELLSGSVSQRVVRLTAHPVVVVPQGGADTAGIGRILAASDASPGAASAVRWAAELAERIADVRLTILHVEPAPSSAGAPSPQVPGGDGGDEETGAAFAAARELTAGLGKRVDFQVVRGEAASQIVAAARAGNHQLIVMGRRGLNPVAEVVFGGVSDRVLGTAPCPVALVR